VVGYLSKNLITWAFLKRQTQRSSFAFLLLTAAKPSLAANLDQLVQLLSPAYLAQHVTAVCTAQDPTFATQASGHRGPISVYVQVIKEKIIEGLEADEVNRILRRAADAAKAAALMAIRAQAVSDSDEERQRLLSWCGTAGKPFVQEFISSHDQNLNPFEEAIARAKAR